MPFTDETHADAFVDFPPPVVPGDGQQLCAQCKGHGGWNLTKDAYPRNMLGREDTSENRHLYLHFRCICPNCHGVGWVASAQGDHIHAWGPEESLGKCRRLHRCACGAIWRLDSSDCHTFS